MYEKMLIYLVAVSAAMTVTWTQMQTIQDVAVNKKKKFPVCRDATLWFG